MKNKEALSKLKEIKEKTDNLIEELSEKSECQEKIERLILENNSLKETITALRKERNNYLIEELFYNKQMLDSEKDRIKILSFLCYLFIPLSFILLIILAFTLEHS